MLQTTNKVYDLEERCFQFAKEVRIFIPSLPKSIGNIENSKQVVRSSGSVGANYIEANESLSKKNYYENKNLQKRSQRICILAKINY